MTLTVAMGELTRVLPWSFRALGYAFGTADRAAHVVAGAAALDPAVLDGLGQAENRRPGALQIDMTGRDLVVDSTGISLFETGPAVVDVLAARASRDTARLARITGATDMPLLPALTCLGATYGLTVIALTPEAAGGGWTLATDKDGDTQLYRGEDRQGLGDALADTVFAPALQGLGAGDDVVLIAAEGAAERDLPGPGRSYGGALTTAYARGVPVTLPTLNAFYKMEEQTWAPSSERSRAQAGFTPKEPVVR